MKIGKKLSLCAFLILLQPFCTMFGMQRPAPDYVEQSPLHRAAWYGDEEALTELLKTHDCNQQIIRWGATPLYIAAYNCHINIVKLLLANGANLNIATTNNGATPLYAASIQGHTTIAELLLADGANPNIATINGGTPLYAASAQGHTNIVQPLLTADADVNKALTNGTTPLFIAAHNGHAATVQLLLANGADKDKARTTGTTPLFIAAENGHTNIVQPLLTAGADVNKALTNGTTPLFIAAHNGHAATVQLLLTYGADKNKARNNSVTPLHVAAFNSHANIIRMLLCAGADYNARLAVGAQETPLQCAQSADARTVLEQWPSHAAPTLQLLEGIAANTCTIDRLQELMRDDAQLHSYAIGHRMATPLCLATCNANFPLMRELLRLGADPTITDADGNTPVHCAAQTPILLGLFGMIAIERRVAEKSQEERLACYKQFIEYWNQKFSQPQE